MKKKLLLTISLMLVAVMLMLAGCKSEFEGNYKEATAEQKAEIVAKLNSLETIEENKKSNMKLEGFSEVTTNASGTTSTSKVNVKSVYDHSGSAPMAYISYSMESTAKVGETSVTTKMNFELTVDGVNKKGYVSYSVDGGVASVSLTKAKKGYFDIKDADTEVDDISEVFGGITEFDLAGIIGYFEEEGVNVEVDDNKAKVTVSEEGIEATIYVVFKGETEYKAKMEMKMETEYVSTTTSSEIVPTKEKVSLPKDIESYSEKIDLESLFSGLMGLIG